MKSKTFQTRFIALIVTLLLSGFFYSSAILGRSNATTAPYATSGVKA